MVFWLYLILVRYETIFLWSSYVWSHRISMWVCMCRRCSTINSIEVGVSRETHESARERASTSFVSWLEEVVEGEWWPHSRCPASAFFPCPWRGKPRWHGILLIMEGGSSQCREPIEKSFKTLQRKQCNPEPQTRSLEHGWTTSLTLLQGRREGLPFTHTRWSSETILGHHPKSSHKQNPHPKCSPR